MPGIDCKCGKYLNTSSFPCDYCFKMFSEKDYDEIDDPVNRRSLALLFLKSIKVYRCPYCSRLIIEDRENGSLDTYIREDS